MKKCLVFFVICALLFTFVLAVGAEAENEATEGGELVPAPVDGVSGENAAGENYASESWFAEAKEWISEHFSGLLVSLVALWTACPKIGGIALIRKRVKGLTALVAAVKFVVADEKNEKSVLNTMKSMCMRFDEFTGKLAPVLENLQTRLSVIDDLAADLKAGKLTEEKLKNVLIAVEEGQELMAKEFNDLISTSTTISAKTKADMEAAFMAAREHLHATVKEAVNEQEGEKASA